MATLFWFGYAAAADAAIALGFIGIIEPVLPALGQPADPRWWRSRRSSAGWRWLNIRGVRQGARAVELLTLIKLLPLIALVVFGLFAIRGRALAVELPAASALGAASLTIFFAFSGPDAALGPSAEIVDPPRTVPRAMILAVLGIVALYGGLHFVAQGLLGDDLAKETAAPLAAAAGRLWGPAGRTLLRWRRRRCRSSPCVAGDLLATPRALLASARQGGLPARFGAVHPRYRTPYVAIAAFALVIFLLGGHRHVRSSSRCSRAPRCSWCMARRSPRRWCCAGATSARAVSRSERRADSWSRSRGRHRALAAGADDLAGADRRGLLIAVASVVYASAGSAPPVRARLSADSHRLPMIDSHARIEALAAARERIALVLTLLMILLYFGFIALVAFARPILARLVVPGSAWASSSARW